MKLLITKTGFGGSFEFQVADAHAWGSPYVGNGRTMDEALGSFLRNHQLDLGITEINFDEAAWKTELARRRRELAKR